MSASTRKEHKPGLMIATGFGLGYIPTAPGTAGSALGAILYVFLVAVLIQCGASGWQRLTTLLLFDVLMGSIGIWSAGVAIRGFQSEDPRQVVIDEVCGQLITLTPLSIGSPMNWPAIIVGFILFRIFDIFKPYPVRRLERLPGGFGVMLDDVLAGVYGAAVLWAIVQFSS